jgi:glucosylceramidase
LLVVGCSDGPKNNGCLDCRGVVRIRSLSHKIDYNIEFYGMGHFSKFFSFPTNRIQTITSSTNHTTEACVTTTAFANAGNDTVQLVLMNTCNGTLPVTVAYGNDYALNITIPTGLVTMIWSSK